MDWAAVKEARDRLSREQGAIIKDWGGRLPAALVYPNSYYVGMSSLGFQTVYSLLNRHDNILCERAFVEKGRLPPISIETQRPLTDFAVIAFSVSFELDYFNVIQLLKSIGLPLLSADRDETHPLVIGGGPCLIANPLPLSPFFDCICIGEAEAILPAMLPVLSRDISAPREELLKTLSTLPGIYVPRYSTRVERRCAASLDDYMVSSTVLTPDTELGDLYLIEVERGCPWNCRFCLTSTAFRPMRIRSVDKLVAQAEEGLKYRKRIGLVGADVTGHPQIEALLERLRRIGAQLSISSLRIKPLSPVVLGELARAGARTVTLAPEAGSERLRRVINKGINEDDIFRALELAAEQGFKQVKLYFMVGLPSETDEDIHAIIDLTLKCQQLLEKHQPGGRISLNVAPFVPKAETPFQWLPMAPLDVLDKRLSLLKGSLGKKGIKIKSESPLWSEVQAVLSRGDEKVAGVLAAMPEPSLRGWRQAVSENHLDIDFYAHQKWPVERKLPWDMLDYGITPERLKTGLKEALGQSTELA